MVNFLLVPEKIWWK